MNLKLKITAAFVSVAFLAFTQAGSDVSLWLTNPDRSSLFEQQREPLHFSRSTNQNPTIEVNDKEKFQTIDGFGFALTGGSAMHIVRMNNSSRAALLQELFAWDRKNIGISYLRVSIGASDLNERVFSYDDLPDGQTDPEMLKFDLGPDKYDVIPVLKEILAINPKIKILGSPWSPPTWMKTNNDTRGGMLRPEYYGAYAKYFVKYIQGMKANGIRIDAITVQNEPLHPGNNPSLLMVAPDQAIFVKKYLGPAFKAAGIDTKILAYDHNADRPDYPISIFDDPEAAKYIDGSAFHLYNGKIDALTDVHNAHPEKNVYFTEQMVTEAGGNNTSPRTRINAASSVNSLIIGATRNWSRNVLEWNLAADMQNKPFTDRGGCGSCQGAVSIDKDNFIRNVAYYSIAHASKFVRPGSVRIASNLTETLSDVAFLTPDGKKVLIVTNTSRAPQTFNIRYKDQIVTSTLTNGAVGTYVW